MKSVIGMRELYYRLLGRRNYLLKAILITGLLLLGSFIIVLLPQLISPHILSTYLEGSSGGNIEIHQAEYFALDIELYGSSYDPSFIDDFNQTAQTASSNPSAPVWTSNQKYSCLLSTRIRWQLSAT